MSEPSVWVFVPYVLVAGLALAAAWGTERAALRRLDALEEALARHRLAGSGLDNGMRFEGAWDGLQVRGALEHLAYQGSNQPDLKSRSLWLDVAGLPPDRAWTLRAGRLEGVTGPLPSVRAMAMLACLPEASWSLRDGTLAFRCEVNDEEEVAAAMDAVHDLAAELAAPSGPPAADPSLTHPQVLAAVVDAPAPVRTRLRALRGLGTARDGEAVERAARAALSHPDAAVREAALRVVADSPHGYRVAPEVRALAAEGPVAAPVAAAVAAHVTRDDTGLLLDLLARAEDASAAAVLAGRLRFLAGPAEVPRLGTLREQGASHVRRAADTVLAALRDRAVTGAGALSLAAPGVEGGLTLAEGDVSGGISVTETPDD